MTISSVTSRTVAFASSDGMRAVAQSQTSMLSFAAPRSSDEESIATLAPTPEHVAQAVDQVNEAFKQKGQNLHASIEKDQDTGISVVKVTDKDTKEVISQFPSKEILAIAVAIRQYQEDKGYLVDVNA